MKRPLPPELAIQAGFIAALRYVAPGVSCVAVPNGTHIASQAGRRKATLEGRSSGFPDCICLWSGGLCFLEFKRPSGRVSENQREWIERLDRWGHRVAVVRSVDDALAFIEACGAPVVGRLAA